MAVLVGALIVVVLVLALLVVQVLRRTPAPAVAPVAAPVSPPQPASRPVSPGASDDRSHERDAELVRREQLITEREERLAEQARRLEAREQQLTDGTTGLEERQREVESLESQRRGELERVAGLTAADARSELVRVIENDAKREAALIVRDIESRAREEGDMRARKIVVSAIQRCCSEQTTESVVTVMHLPAADMHPELTKLMGQLRYRTSYGQNVLKHLIESGHLAGMMAAELRMDIARCKRGAFLHDIGKALTHEVQGSHAIIGAEIAKKYGEDDDICHAIEAHHNEVEVKTVEAVLTQIADMISGGRPGARRESLEHYVQRLERIEEIASTKDGVEKVFAMQAGREVRVMVKPEEIDDIGAQVIARDVAKQIEEELTYPGQIRVTVVRESRATEVAK